MTAWFKLEVFSEDILTLLYGIIAQTQWVYHSEPTKLTFHLYHARHSCSVFTALWCSFETHLLSSPDPILALARKLKVKSISPLPRTICTYVAGPPCIILNRTGPGNNLLCKSYIQTPVLDVFCSLV